MRYLYNYHVGFIERYCTPTTAFLCPELVVAVILVPSHNNRTSVAIQIVLMLLTLLSVAALRASRSWTMPLPPQPASFQLAILLYWHTAAAATAAATHSLLWLLQHFCCAGLGALCPTHNKVNSIYNYSLMYMNFSQILLIYVIFILHSYN